MPVLEPDEQFPYPYRGGSAGGPGRVVIVLVTVVLAALVFVVSVAVLIALGIRCIGDPKGDAAAWCAAHRGSWSVGPVVVLLGPPVLTVVAGVVSFVRRNIVIVVAVWLVLVPVGLIGSAIV